MEMLSPRARYTPTAWEVSLVRVERTVLDEPVLVRVARRLGAIRHAELAIDVRQVELHGLLGDPELLRDCFVGEAAGDGADDHELSIGQPCFLGDPLAALLGDADGREDVA